MKIVNILPFIILLLVFSCKKQQPQLPANKSVENDTTCVEMVEINRKLIEIEDSTLAVHLKNLETPFLRDSLGYWYQVHSKSVVKSTKSDSIFAIDYKVYSLAGELLIKKTEKIETGKKQIISAIENILQKMTVGDSATLLSPWYLAYGTRGDGINVEPYQSVKIELKVINTVEN